MKKLLIATHNKAKIEEITEWLQPLKDKGIELLSLADVNVTEDPEETGTTFLENAQLKAEYYGNRTGIPTVSDDGGIMIDILNGEPGVKSKRWPGYAASDKELIAYALKKLDGIPPEKRTAKFHTCLYFYEPSTKTAFYEEEDVYGSISQKSTGRPTNGFPFRALFIVKDIKKFYDELTRYEHHQINHRLKALKRLSKKMEEFLLK